MFALSYVFRDTKLACLLIIRSCLIYEQKDKVFLMSICINGHFFRCIHTSIFLLKRLCNQ